MRHQCKRHRLGRPQDQRKALLRSLASSLLMHGEIKTTMAKAKALKPYVEQIISLAKKGDLHSRRQAVKLIFDQQTGKQIADGLNRPTASTGKSIDELHGAAKRIAQISNIGGGSKSTGGGGLDKGLDTVAKHVQARTAKAIIDNAKQKKLGKGKT